MNHIMIKEDVVPKPRAGLSAGRPGQTQAEAAGTNGHSVQPSL